MVKQFVKYANSPKGRKMHRWVSAFAAAYVIMATLSGIVHIVMANFYTPPPPVLPQGILHAEKITLSPAAAVQKMPGKNKSVKNISLRSALGKTWYQIIIQDNPIPYYIDAMSGELGRNIDETYAQDIARQYLRTNKTLEKTAFLTQFNDEYLNIFRMLPVYRFDEDGSNGVRVYVSTVTGSVALYLNAPRAFGQNAFSTLHKLSFIPHKLIRDILQTLLVLAIIYTTVMGIGIMIGRKQPNR